MVTTGKLSKRRRITLTALLIAAGAGLAALPSLWPGFHRYEESTDQLLTFGAGWFSRMNYDRPRRRAERPDAVAERP